jgi:hypothetical protein
LDAVEKVRQGGMNARARPGACRQAARRAESPASLRALRLLQIVPGKQIHSRLFDRAATTFLFGSFVRISLFVVRIILT